MLTEVIDKYNHYFEDENGLLQGPYRWHNVNDGVIEFGFFKNSKKHGECILYSSTGFYKFNSFSMSIIKKFRLIKCPILKHLKI